MGSAFAVQPNESALSGRGPMPRAARPTCQVCQKPDGASDSPVRFKALLDGPRAGNQRLARLLKTVEKGRKVSAEH